MLRIQIIDVEREEGTDIVLRVKYSLDLIETVGDSRYESSVVGKIDLPPPPAPPAPFAFLTEADVQAWVSSALGGVFLAEVEAKLQVRNMAKKNPATVNGMPWTAGG
jgi:hypothetical protein